MTDDEDEDGGDELNDALKSLRPAKRRLGDLRGVSVC